MTHDKVLKRFEFYFPDYAGINIDVWFPNGSNSIRVRHINGRQEFIFTFKNDVNWRFETINSFIECRKRG